MPGSKEGSKACCEAKAARLLAKARPRGSKILASTTREWHISTATFHRDSVNVVIVRDSRDVLQLGWQFSSKLLIGEFRRSAKADWAT